MTSPEFDKLAVLLRTLCPNAPEEITITGDKKTALAYFYALSPYTYEQAKAGALAALRKSRRKLKHRRAYAQFPECNKNRTCIYGNFHSTG